MHKWERHLQADSRFAPNQWETPLQSNGVSHWLGANLKSALPCHWDASKLDNIWCLFWNGPLYYKVPLTSLVKLLLLVIPPPLERPPVLEDHFLGCSFNMFWTHCVSFVLYVSLPRILSLMCCVGVKPDLVILCTVPEVEYIYNYCSWADSKITVCWTKEISIMLENSPFNVFPIIIIGKWKYEVINSLESSSWYKISALWKSLLWQFCIWGWDQTFISVTVCVNYLWTEKLLENVDVYFWMSRMWWCLYSAMFFCRRLDSLLRWLAVCCNCCWCHEARFSLNTLYCQYWDSHGKGAVSGQFPSSKNLLTQENNMKFL